MKYQLFGLSIKDILDDKILEIPDYIKIDVDGIEHLILSGAENYLKDPNIKSISVEINENFKTQFSNIIEIMKKNNFSFLEKNKTMNLKIRVGHFPNHLIIYLKKKKFIMRCLICNNKTIFLENISLM